MFEHVHVEERLRTEYLASYDQDDSPLVGTAVSSIVIRVGRTDGESDELRSLRDRPVARFNAKATVEFFPDTEANTR